ncbi:MAPEG family protein [Kovacikia minuta CCNUW1]|uniref:MAPEG family protein n=1 Tax=Kovacikia minuta TaxID=2931930 RepID=UPI001CCEB211|nr:MAPEG family protein [Kovacikia minuta]UBF24819.1 MAPEG family protein [Kovacikia minuta CCNUW1]
MSIPVAVLLGFAGWTLITLLATVGIYRWSRILTGRAKISEFPADVPHGEEWYRRAIRAHANCVENLPVYGAIVVAMIATGVHSSTLDILAVVFLIARVLQTIVHIAFKQTNLVTSIRFGFFFLQLICMFAMGAIVAINAV